MARKQARKRKPQKKAVEFRLPKINWGRILKPLFAVALILLTYDLSSRMLERPVKSIEITGPMQRVSVVQIEDAIESEIAAGFFASDLSDMRETIRSLQWIDQAAVARRWPNRIAISVTEQVPAAVWGERRSVERPRRTVRKFADAQHLAGRTAAAQRDLSGEFGRRRSPVPRACVDAARARWASTCSEVSARSRGAPGT